MDGYQPLEDYGLIGNLETCALLGDDGSIDWCCFPHLESPSVFARILDAESGGHFAIRPTATFESSRSYVDRTNVLETTFETGSGTAVETSFMPVFETEDVAVPKRAIFRRVTCAAGSMRLALEFRPRFDYARVAPTLDAVDGGVLATGSNGTGSEPEEMLLSGDLQWNVHEERS